MAQICFLILISWFSCFGFADSELSRLVSILYEPQEIDVPEVNRKKYAEAAKALGVLLRDNPNSLDEQVKLQIQSLLISKSPKHKAAQNDLNKYLPQELVAEFDKKVTQARLHPSNFDPCKVMCRAAQKLSEQVDESLNLKEDAYLENADSRRAFGGAVRSLIGEFLIKAQHSGCRIHQLDQKVLKLLNQIDASRTKTEKRGMNDNLAFVHDALREAGDSSSVERAIEFLNKTSASSNWDEIGLPTQSAALFYLIHTYRFAQTLQRFGTERDEKKLDLLMREIEERLKKVIDSKERLIEAQGASLVTVYSIGALGVSLPTGNVLQKSAAEALEKKRMRLREGKEVVFPYNFAVSSEEVSERAGAARTVVAQLAIYQGGPNEKKLVNADYLLSSIESYNRHFRDIFSGIGLNQTHDFEDSDLLAPYYGPATIPYVFEALSALEMERGMSSTQKNQLDLLRTELQKKLLGMFEPEGLFQQQHKKYYSAAHYYDNALVGLALENACRFQRENKPKTPQSSLHQPVIKSIPPSHSLPKIKASY